MKFIFRLITTAIVLGVLAAAGLGFYAFTHRGELVEGAVTEATGNSSAGNVAGKLASGQDLSDDELQGLLGVDDKTYAKIKSAAERIGINVNDGSQMREVVAKNSKESDVLKEVIDGISSGQMSVDEAADLLASSLKLP